jgi:NADPH:quinone reductase
VSQIPGTVSSPAKRQMALDHGFSDVVMHDELERLLADTLPADKVDVVFDAVGGPIRQTAFDHLAPFGRMIIFGNASGTDAKFHGDTFWHEMRTVSGLSLGGITHLEPGRVQTAANHLLGWISRGDLRPSSPHILLLRRPSACTVSLRSDGCSVRPCYKSDGVRPALVA